MASCGDKRDFFVHFVFAFAFGISETLIALIDLEVITQITEELGNSEEDGQ
jgi:hypothetical protein